MDIMAIVNAMQPNTIKAMAINANDFPNKGTGIPFMGVFVQLFPNTVLPIEASVIQYEATYNSSLAIQAANASLEQQISALESTQTPRRMREALSDPTWMNVLNMQISALRSQLK